MVWFTNHLNPKMSLAWSNWSSTQYLIGQLLFIQAPGIQHLHSRQNHKQILLRSNRSLTKHKIRRNVLLGSGNIPTTRRTTETCQCAKDAEVWKLHRSLGVVSTHKDKSPNPVHGCWAFFCNAWRGNLLIKIIPRKLFPIRWNQVSMTTLTMACNPASCFLNSWKPRSIKSEYSLVFKGLLSPKLLRGILAAPAWAYFHCRTWLVSGLCSTHGH